MPLKLIRTSIRAKIVTLCVTLVSVIAISIAIYFTIVQKQSILEAMQLRDRVLAEMVALAVGMGMEEGDFPAVTRSFEWAKSNEDLLFIMVLDENDEVVASFDPGNLKYDVATLSKLGGVITLDGIKLHLVKTPITHRGKEIGMLYYGNSLSAMRSAIKETIENVIYLSLVIMLIGSLVAFFLSKTITLPLRELQYAAQKMSEGNTNVQVAVTTTDEVGVLGGIFNEMAANVRKSVKILKESRKESRLIIDTAVEAFISVDFDDNVLDWNTQAERTTGWARQEILGQSLQQKIILPSHRKIYAEMFRRLRKVTRAFRFNKPIKMAVLHRSGDVIEVDVQIWTIRRGGKTVLNAFVRVRSENVQKKAEEHRFASRSLV